MKKEHTPQPNTLRDKILDTITSKDIQPTPKWHFILKEDVLWGVWIVSVILGASAVAGMLYAISNVGWRYYSVSHGSLTAFVFDALPYFWIISLFVCLVIACINVRYTKKGYRYTILAVLGTSIGASLLIGFALFFFGAGDYIDRRVAGQLPFHTPVFMFERARWEKPEKGLLFGTVETQGDSVVIVDAENVGWNLITESLVEKDIQILRSFDAVRVVGLPATSTDSFYACFVFPWDPDLRGLPQKPLVDIERDEHMMNIERMFTKLGERKLDMQRSNICKGVRPYDSLQYIRNNVTLPR